MNNKTYEVYIGDNYDYMSTSKFPIASFDTLDDAIEYCKSFVVRDLSGLYEPGIIPADLCVRWGMFGEDPFIRGGNHDGILFSARSFVTHELCKNVIDSLSSN